MADHDYEADARELLGFEPESIRPSVRNIMPRQQMAALQRVAARLQADAELLEQRRIDITAYEQQVEQLEAQLAAARDAGVQREEAYIAAVKEAHGYKAELLRMQSRLEHAERQNELRSKALGIVARRERSGEGA